METTSVRVQTTSLHLLIDQYLHYCVNNKHYAKGTVKHRVIYLGMLERFLAVNDIHDVLSITRYDIDDFIAYKATHIQKTSVNDILRSLRMFFKWVYGYKEIELQFKPHLTIEYITAKRTLVKPIRHELIMRAIRLCRNPQDKLVIATLYETGMRISELADFKIEDLTGDEIWVRGKGSKDRLVYVTDNLANQLRDWALVKGWTTGCFFRPLQHGGDKYKDIETLRRRIKDVFALIGVDMHPHQIRHSFAVRMLKNGTDIRTLQMLLGHEKLETTMRYLNLSDQWLRKQYKQKYGKSAFN